MLSELENNVLDKCSFWYFISYYSIFVYPSSVGEILNTKSLYLIRIVSLISDIISILTINEPITHKLPHITKFNVDTFEF